MKTEILGTLSTTSDVVSVWGFGSFFRGDPRASDIDIVAVVARNDLALDVVQRIRQRFDEIGVAFGQNVDLTILTYSEFDEKPLQEMDVLVPLYKRELR